MKQQIPDNERKSCDAVARAIETVSGSARQNAFSPEDSGQDGQVEYVFDIGDISYAAEHTLVEAFAGQLRSGLDFANFIEPISGALAGTIPLMGVYHLNFSIDPTKGFKASEIPKLREAIVSWTQATAASLHAKCPKKPSKLEKPYGYRAFERSSVLGIEVHLSWETIWSISPKHDGKIFVGRFAPPDHEELRDERLVTAIEKKLPKLSKCKAAGARTLLILESQDIALSNHGVISVSLEKAISGRADIPDEIWLVDTTIESQWTVWCLLSGDKIFPFGDGRYKYFEFYPDMLTEV